MSIHTFHCRWFQTLIEPTRICYPRVRVGVLFAAGFAAALLAGCGELEPMREPEMVDLELTTDTLKASVRDAQRMVAELRADLEARRRELAESQVARAQLEGRVREAERRVVEARQVIDLQREELAAARTERVQVSRNSFQLQSQMKLLQKQLSRKAKSYEGQEAVPLPSSDAIQKGQNAMQLPAQRNQPSEFSKSPQSMTASVAVKPVLGNQDFSLREEQPIAISRHVFVKPGDTLWSISQKYRVPLKHLRILNQLPDNTIVIGQALWLPDGRSMPEVGADKSASMP
jgi:LysM repeat protein